MKLLTEDIYAYHIKFTLVSLLYAHVSQQAADIHQVDLKFILRKGLACSVLSLTISGRNLRFYLYQPFSFFINVSCRTEALVHGIVYLLQDIVFRQPCH